MARFKIIQSTDKGWDGWIAIRDTRFHPDVYFAVLSYTFGTIVPASYEDKAAQRLCRATALANAKKIVAALNAMESK